MRKANEMKKSAVMFLTTAMVAACAWADTWADPATGLVWHYQVDANGDAILNTGPAIPVDTGGALIIPSEFEGHATTKVYGSAFGGCHQLTSIRFPETVSYIWWGNFVCSNLTSFTISNGNPYYTCIDGVLYNAEVTQLIKVPMRKTSVVLPDTVVGFPDWYCFYGCEDLETLTLSRNMTYLWEGCLEYCPNLNNVIVPYGSTLVSENGVIYDSYKSTLYFVPKNLTSFVVPSTVYNIGGYALNGCTSLTSIVLPPSLHYIGNSAFSGCISLKDVTFEGHVSCDFASVFSDTPFWNDMPDGLIVLGNVVVGVKGECPEDVVIPEGIVSIAEYAFEGCDAMQTVSFPNTLTNIGYAAFGCCAGLTNVRLPDSLKDIGYNVFDECENLQTIYMPDGIDFVEKDLFSSCPSLYEIQVSNTNPQFRNVGGALYDKKMESLVFVPRDSWSFQITNTVKTIRSYAFEDCQLLEDVTIPPSVMRIESEAFWNSKLLTDAPNGVVIKNGCLLGYNGDIPRTITLNGVRLIAEGVFRWNSTLETVVLPEGVENLNGENFYCCYSLRSISIPASLKSVGSNFLRGCTELLSVVVASDNPILSSIGGVVFDKQSKTMLWINKNATSITVPEGVTAINGTEYFDGCTNLVVLTLPSSMTYLGGGALRGASNLETIYVASGNSNYRSVNGIVLSKDGLTVVCAPPAKTDLVIPEGVTQIFYGTFQSNTKIVSVTLPESLMTINGSAFEGCSSLVDFNIPTNVTSIGANAFRNTAWWNNQPDGLVIKDNCALGVKGNMTDVDVPEGCRLLSDGIFRSSNITSVHLPDSITNLPTCFFAWNKSLASVDLPVGLTKISSQLFDGCSSLSSIKIPSGVVTIEEYAFRGCTALKTVTLPSSVTSIGRDAFNDCSGLKAVVLSENLSKIEDGCFRGCSSLQLFMIPAKNEHFVVVDGVLYSKDMTRLVCSPAGIEAIDIPDTVVEIEESAFYGCSKLMTIDLPPSLKSIGSSAFAGCTALTAITIPGEVIDIPYSAFQNCTSITNVFLPDGVRSIGSQAFAGCISLESINIPTGVESIYDGAFDGTKYLDDMDDGVVIINGVVLGVKGTCPEEIVLPDGVKQIVDSAFEGCSQLVSIKIPDSVISIGYRAFTDCDMLQTVELPNGLSWLNQEMFSGCRSLRNVVIKEGVTQLGWRVFYGCEALESVHLPDSLIYLYGGAFEECSSLTNLNIPASVQEVYDADILVGLPSLVDVDSCPGLKLIDGWIMGYDEMALPEFLEIPNSIKGIANWGFYDCDTLISVTIPGSIKRIAYDAFSNCRNLLVVDLLEGVESIESGAFSGCENMTLLTIPDSVVNVDNDIVANTAIYDNAPDGPVVVDGWLLAWKGQIPENVVVPDGIHHFPSRFWWQFWWNGEKGFRSITLPESMTNIAAFAFACCPLEQVNVQGINTTIDSFAFLGCPESCHVDMVGRKPGYRFSGWLAENGATDFVRCPDYNYTNGWLYVEGATWYIEQFRTNGTVRIKIGEEYLLQPEWEGITRAIDILGYVFDGLGVVLMGDDGSVSVTLTNDVSGTVEIPDNVGAVTIDLNGHDMVGGGGALGESALPGPAIRIVSGEGAGETTRLTIGDTSDGEKGQVVGGRESAGIEIAEGVARGVSLDVDDTVSVLNGDGTEQDCRRLGRGSLPWPADGAYNPLVANVYDGYVLGEDGSLAGIIQVKAAKQAVKTVTDRVTKVKTVTTNVAVTATVTDAAGKKWSYAKGVGTVDGVVTGLVCTTKGVLVPSFGVTLGANGLEGEWGDFVIEGARNGMGVKGDAMTATLDAYYKKSWSVALTNEQGLTRLQLVVGAKGSTKISGTTADGFKVSATVQGVMGEDAFLVPYLATLKNGKLTRSANLLLSLGKDGTVVARTSDLGVLKAAGPTTDEIEVLPYDESESSKGGEAYAGAVVLNDLAYPAKFAAKGLPAGLKIDAATGAITGTPTKPGHYTATITVTSGVNGKKKVETTVDFDIGNYTDTAIGVEDSYSGSCVGVMASEPIAAALGCTVSGLPAGLKFAAKETKDKTFGTVAAGTVYGVPTKAGEYTVYFKKSEKVNGKTVNHQASATFRVEALPAWAQGTFDGAVAARSASGPYQDGNDGHAGRVTLPSGLVTLTVTANGKISGKIIDDAGTWTLAAAAYASVECPLSDVEGAEPPPVFYATVIGKSGKMAITNEMEVSAEEVAGARDARPYQRGVVSGWAASEPPVEWMTWQNLWKTEPWKTEAKAFAKAPALIVEVGGGRGATALPGVPSVPDVTDVTSGTITLKFAASGAVTASGKFVTGQDARGRDVVYSASCSSALVPAAAARSVSGPYRIFLYFPPKAGKFEGYSTEISLVWDGAAFVVE